MYVCMYVYLSKLEQSCMYGILILYVCMYMCLFKSEHSSMYGVVVLYVCMYSMYVVCSIRVFLSWSIAVCIAY